MASPIKLRVSKNTVVFVEPNGDESSQRVSAASSGSSSRESNFVEEQFDKVSASIVDIVTSLEQSLSDMTSKPKEVEIEMGAAIRGSADLWLVKGEGESHLKVKMIWRD